MYPHQIEEMKRLQKWLDNDTFTGKTGELRWKSTGRPVPLDVFPRAQRPTPAAQAEAVEISLQLFLKEYRESQKNHQPSAEEMFEMRAAFGTGTTVVNVLTGRKTRL